MIKRIVKLASECLEGNITGLKWGLVYIYNYSNKPEYNCHDGDSHNFSNSTNQCRSCQRYQGCVTANIYGLRDESRDLRDQVFHMRWKNISLITEARKLREALEKSSKQIEELGKSEANMSDGTCVQQDWIF